MQPEEDEHDSATIKIRGDSGRMRQYNRGCKAAFCLAAHCDQRYT